MARMLGHSMRVGCWCWDCRLPRSWKTTMRRAARAAENRAWLAEVDPWDLHVEPDEAARAATAPRRSGMRWHFRADPQAVTGRRVRAR